MSNVLRVICVAALFVTLSPFALAQQRSEAPDHQFSAKDVPSSIEVLSAERGATVFTDRAAFEAACGALVTETFEEAALASGESLAIGAPLPPEDGVVFQPGDIEDGLVITVDSTFGTLDDLFVARDFFSVGVQVGNNRFSDKLIHNFSPAVECAGYNVDLNRNGTATTLRAVDAAGNTLGSTSISGFDLFFFGVQSAEPVAALIADGDLSEEWVDADDVSFSMAAAENFVVDATPEAQSVPQGGTANFSVKITNNTANNATGQLCYKAGPLAPVLIASGTVAANSMSPNIPVSINVPGAAPPGTYNVQFRVGPNCNTVLASDDTDVTVTAARTADTSTEWTLQSAPTTFGLEAAARTSEIGAYPNPFVERTEIAYTLEESAKVQLVIYDVLGREVVVLTDELMEAGTHTATFEARGLATGTYIYRLVAGDEVQSGRITLMK